MKIIEVKRPADWQLFHGVNERIYQSDPNYIRPLESDIEAVFDPKKNKAFAHGHAACFVLLDGAQAIGRIAAFIDHERNKTNEYPVGGLGFFECIDDEAAARLLFDRAEAYLSQWEVKAIDGPINFGERDKFCGLLVQGDLPPVYQENYHPAYYQHFFMARGYMPYEQILTFHGRMSEIPIERFRNIAQRVRQRYGLRSESMDSGKNIPRFANDFAEVYNKAFKDNPYFKPLEGRQLRRIFKMMKPVADFKMIFITYAEGKPVAFAAFMPDLNPYLRKYKGKLHWYQVPNFLLRTRQAKAHPLKGIAFGIDPEYQRRGAFAALIDYIYSEHTRSRYPDFYLATIRGHNTVMVKSISNLGVEVERVHLAYRKMIDQQLPLQPFPFIHL